MTSCGCVSDGLISIHAPHARSDLRACRISAPYGNFNPRSSCEERHLAVIDPSYVDSISIHAPHARSDTGPRADKRSAENFNPRSSCEERLFDDGDAWAIDDFNPRSSCEERQRVERMYALCKKFQSTLLMRGATMQGISDYHKLDFNPRSSCEERRTARLDVDRVEDFNPRSSCEERPVFCSYR